MNNNHVTISHPAFINIISNCIIKFKMMIFINKKYINHIIVTSKPDIYQNFNIQMFNIFKHDLLSILLFNVYNEK